MSVLSTSTLRSNQQELVAHVFRLQGAGAAVLTISEPANAAGVSVGRTSAGIYTLTWTDDPGSFVGATYGFEDTTPANLDDHSCITDNYASKVLTFTVYDGSPAVDDLESTEYLTVVAWFKQTGV